MWIDESAGGGKYAADQIRMTYGVSRQQAAQSGSWSYDRDTLTKISKEWRALEDDCARAETDCVRFASVDPPGKEYVSENTASEINNSNRDYVRMLGEMKVYAGEQAVVCEKALGTYEESEDERKSFFTDLFARLEGEQRESGGLL